MQNRTLSYLLSTSLIFVGLLLVSNYFFPPKAAQPLAVAPQTEKEAGDSDPATESPDSSPSDSTAKQDESSNGDPAASESNASPAADLAPPQFFTLGSLAQKSSDRFLVTFSNRGGVVSRIELNSRDSNGRQRYRDLTHFGGYIGKLQLQTIDQSVVVGVVGPGTPADQAGLQAGDRIIAFDSEAGSEPVVSPNDFDRLLAKIRPDETITLRIERGQGENRQELSLAIRSSEQPLELLRPESDTLGTGSSSPPSFQLVLMKPPAATDEVQSSSWAVIDAHMRSSPWNVSEVTIEGRPGLEFSYRIDEATAAKVKLAGPIEVVKRYWLPALDDSTRFAHASRTYHLNLQIIVRNLSNQKQLLGLELDGPTGATTEGWWYQNKINGDSRKWGYTAGARDVVGSTSATPFVFYGCPEIVSNIQKANPRFLWIANPNSTARDKTHAELKYLGVDTQYFNISLLPVLASDNSRLTYECYSAMASIVSSMLPKQAALRRLVDCTFFLFEKFEIEAQGEHRQRYEIFAGPKEVDLLATYGLDDTRSFGFAAWFSKFLCWLLTVLYKLTFSYSYGLAIILLTVIVRLLMIPLSRKAAINAQMMQLLAPEMKALAEKYKDDMEKRAQAQRDLYRRYKFNPFGGCFLIFLQLPIFIGLYRGLSVDIALRDQPLIPGMRWCSNLAAPDSLFYWENWMPAFLGSETGWFGPWFNVLPLVTIVLFLIQQKMFTPPPTDDQQALTQKMMTYMMIFMGVMFFKVPAGLCIYFITSSLWGIAERKLLPKPKLSEDKVKAITGGGPTAEESSQSAKPNAAGGLVNRIRDAIEQRSKPEPQLNPEELKRLDRERRKKLKDRGY